MSSGLIFIDYLGQRKDLVLVHWACEKIKSMNPVEEDDYVIANTIKDRVFA